MKTAEKKTEKPRYSDKQRKDLTAIFVVWKDLLENVLHYESFAWFKDMKKLAIDTHSFDSYYDVDVEDYEKMAKVLNVARAFLKTIPGKVFAAKYVKTMDRVIAFQTA